MAVYTYSTVDDVVLQNQFISIEATLDDLEWELRRGLIDADEIRNHLSAQRQYRERKEAALREMDRRGMLAGLHTCPMCEKGKMHVDPSRTEKMESFVTGQLVDVEWAKCHACGWSSTDESARYKGE